MSASYRITIERNLHAEDWPWTATVFRLSDDTERIRFNDASRDEAIEQARQWIAADGFNTHRQDIYTDDDGNQVTAPNLLHSVKVPEWPSAS